MFFNFRYVVLFFFFFFVVRAEEDVHRVADDFLRRIGFLRPEDMEDALIGFFFGLAFVAFAFLFLDHADSVGDEVADDLFDVTADVAYFRIFRGFDLDKGRADEAGQTAGDFRFADACRADEEDVLRNDFRLHIFAQVLAAPAVTQGNGHGFFGFTLADDVFIQFGYDLFRR